ncbi:MAG: hypothetical protein ACLU4N_13495 [Butyricimonas faecihominis]
MDEFGFSFPGEVGEIIDLIRAWAGIFVWEKIRLAIVRVCFFVDVFVE